MPMYIVVYRHRTCTDWDNTWWGQPDNQRNTNVPGPLTLKQAKEGMRRARVQAAGNSSGCIYALKKVEE